MANKTKKGGAAETPHVHTPEVQRHPDDDLIAVPRGQSRLQFYFTLGLLIFVLLIFTVGGLFESVVGGVFGGGGASEVALRWVDPGTGEARQVGYPEFITRKRVLDRMAYIGAFVPANVRAGGEQRPKVSDEDTAQWYLLDAGAQRAGVRVTDEEVAARLRQMFGDGPTMRRAAQSMRTTPSDIEAELRSVLRTEKYRGFLLSSLAVADMQRVRELWEEANREYRFDYVETAVEDYTDLAAAEVPADAELAEWFRTLPEFRKRRFYTEAEYVVDVAWVPLGDEVDAGTLLERYPAPEDVDEAAAARSYFNQFTNMRFRVPEEPVAEGEGEEGEGEEGEGEAASEGEAPAQPGRLFFEFEEVEERARREAAVHAAMGRWLADLTSRAAGGEEIDLAAEAAALGLSAEVGAPSRTMAELQEAEGFGGRFVASQLAFGLEPGAFVTRPIVDEHALVVGRLVEEVPASEPPFDQIRERVVEEWTKEHAIELATRALAAVRARLGAGEEEGVVPSADAETFAANDSHAGRRSWADGLAPCSPSDDRRRGAGRLRPDAIRPATGASPARTPGTAAWALGLAARSRL